MERKLVLEEGFHNLLGYDTYVLLSFGSRNSIGLISEYFGFRREQSYLNLVSKTQLLFTGENLNNRINSRNKEMREFLTISYGFLQSGPV